MSLRRSPLHEFHISHGAKLTDFGGWEMPVAFPDGTVAEHLGCRNDAVWFDVSHLGTVRCSGQDAYERLQYELSNDLEKVSVGRAQYSHLLNDHGGVTDDVIVWWKDANTFDVMPNASNTDNVCNVLRGQDITPSRAVIAIQGPNARRYVEKVNADAAAVGHFRITTFSFAGVACTAAGTGYTGEDGVECAVPIEVATAFAEALAATGVAPAGLGARDTLRLEAGLPLYGHELQPDVTPLQARLSWVVGWDKPAFRGRDALLAEREVGTARQLFGLVTNSRQPLRDKCAVFKDEQRIGETTSGNYSPVLQHGIALAFLPSTTALDDVVTVDIRGRKIPTTVTALPFVQKVEK